MSKFAREPTKEERNRVSDDFQGRAYEALLEMFPDVIKTLKMCIDRSKLVEDCCSCSVCQMAPALVGGPVANKLRKLTKKIKRLDFCVSSLLKQQFRLKQSNALIYWTQIRENSLRFKKLLDKETKLYDFHRDQHRTFIDAESVYQKSCLDNIHLKINHPIFDDHRQHTEADEIQVPLKTVDLTGKIFLVIDILQEGFDNLRSWIKHLDVPVGKALLTLTETLVEFCQSLHRTQNTYLIGRLVLFQRANVCPSVLSDLKSLDLYETSNAVDWQRFANRIFTSCEQIMKFVISHIHVLDRLQMRGKLMALSLSAVLQ